MGIFAFFSLINIVEIGGNLSTVISMILLPLCVATPYIVYLINLKYESKIYKEQFFKDEPLDNKLKHPGYKFRTFFHHLNTKSSTMKYFYPMFYGRKVL